MKFFLQTGFGDSKEFASTTGRIKTQGMCQGNGAVPAGWTVDSIAMLNAHKRKGQGIQLQSLITKQSTQLAGSIFVDDTNVEHLDMNKAGAIEEAHGALQESTTNWGWLLIATGGALKPAKGLYHIIFFAWKQDGGWRYEANESRADLEIIAPLADRTSAHMEHLPVSTPTKTLEQMTCPTGCSQGAILQMKEKAQNGLIKQKVENSIDAMYGSSWISNSGLGCPLVLAALQPVLRNSTIYDEDIL